MLVSPPEASENTDWGSVMDGPSQLVRHFSSCVLPFFFSLNKRRNIQCVIISVHSCSVSLFLCVNLLSVVSHRTKSRRFCSRREVVGAVLN